MTEEISCGTDNWVTSLITGPEASRVRLLSKTRGKLNDRVHPSVSHMTLARDAASDSLELMATIVNMSICVTIQTILQRGQPLTNLDPLLIGVVIFASIYYQPYIVGSSHSMECLVF